MSVSTMLAAETLPPGLLASIRACYQTIFRISIPWSFSKIPLEPMIMKSSSWEICIAVISGCGIINSVVSLLSWLKFLDLGFSGESFTLATLPNILVWGILIWHMKSVNSFRSISWPWLLFPFLSISTKPDLRVRNSKARSSSNWFPGIECSLLRLKSLWPPLAERMALLAPMLAQRQITGIYWSWSSSIRMTRSWEADETFVGASAFGFYSSVPGGCCLIWPSESFEFILAKSLICLFAFAMELTSARVGFFLKFGSLKMTLWRLSRR